MGRFIKGKYKSLNNGKIFTRTDVLLTSQNARKIGEHIANVNGAKLISYKTFWLTDSDYRKRYNIGINR